MKRTAIALLCAASAATAASGQEHVKLGVLLGFTGPIESLTPQMAWAAELAAAEASGSGNFLGGSTVSTVRGDSTCIDSRIGQCSFDQSPLG